jgi:hypothetical protein
MTAFYLDVHVPSAISMELRRRGADVLTAREDDTAELTDQALLERANSLGRVIFTQDIRFKALAESWQREGRTFAGLIFGHQLHGSIGQYVRDLELVAKATDPADWVGQVEQLPLR